MAFMKLRTINHYFIVILSVGLAACATQVSNKPRTLPESGYTLITTDNQGNQFYVAPDSRDTVIISDSKTGQNLSGPVIKYSAAISYANGHLYRFVSTADCKTKGSFWVQTGVNLNNGMGNVMTGWKRVEATYGSPDWAMWKFVCNQ